MNQKIEWNEIDCEILRAQFPSLFIFEDWFSEEEEAELNRLEEEADKN